MNTQEEIIAIVQAEIDRMIASFIRKFWYVVIGLALTSVGAWYSLFYQVQQLDAQREADVAYNKEQIADNQKQIDILRSDYKSDIKEMKEDLQYIRNRI